ncbi:MAG: LIC12162 family protein [Syntrophorhabdaceae bacterium]|nr:LIC12162 family protein [Syntrophorhabdaceae bacterium]
MFLATTALEEFWDKSKEILFLGEWCKIYSRKHIWEKLKYRVLPYHWDDRNKLYNDYLYLDVVYERYLGVLTEILNKNHREKHSEHYWRIIIGPWLFYFIEILFDRYESIKNASESGMVTDTWILNCEEDFFTPYDFEDFFINIIDDNYNNMLFSYLIKKCGSIPYTVKGYKLEIKNNRFFITHGTFRNSLLKLLSIYHKCLPDSSKKYIFFHSRLKLKDLIKLQAKLNQFPSLYTGYSIKSPHFRVDKMLRQKILLKAGTNKFESVLDVLIPYQIPFLYIEGYDEFRREIYKELPAKVKIIFTANASIGIESFKFWAADQWEKGAKLILTQHGGHHGMALWSSELKHEIDISDVYFSWGWSDKNNNKVHPMPSGQLFKLKKNKIRPDINGVILWVMMGIPRYSYWLYSIPVSSQMLSYFDEQKRFYECLRDDIKKLLLLKPYMKDFGWNDRMRFRDLMPEAMQYDGRLSMLELLKDSRLFIGTYNSTTYLETFVVNFPTILFWNPKHWELQDDVKSYFEMLHDVGMLHDTPESAAVKVNDIFSDPNKWWNSESVQRARVSFCNRFALTDEKWIDIWSEKLKRVDELK